MVSNVAVGVQPVRYGRAMLLTRAVVPCRFHVHNHSSAHIYLRLPKGETIDDVVEDIVHECAQLTKANSIEGCKLSHVPVVYTPWANLRKTADMKDGQVGFHDRHAVKMTVVEHRVNAIVNRLNKTKVEVDKTPSEFDAERRERDKAEAALDKEARVALWKQAALERQAAAEKKAVDEALAEQTLYGMQVVDHAAAEAQAAETERKIAEWKKQGASERGKGVSNDALVEDLFSGVVDKGGFKSKKKGNKGGSLADADVAAATGLPLAPPRAPNSAPPLPNSAPAEDDDNLWGGGDDEDEGFWGAADEADDFYGGGGAGGGGAELGRLYAEGAGGAGAQKMDKSLGALGQQAVAVMQAAKSADEMAQLTELAHRRKAEAAKKAAEAQKAKSAAEAQAAAALEQRRAEQHGLAAQAAAEVAAGVEAARAALEAAASSAGLDELHSANRVAQDEELMVIEAIYGDGLVREDGGGSSDGHASFCLLVVGETAKGAEAAIKLAVTFVPEYPSHLPPHVTPTCDAFPLDALETARVRDSLHALFFRRRAEAAAGDPPEGVVSCHWTEWLKEEWLATKG